jgi:hypothetical protein
MDESLKKILKMILPGILCYGIALLSTLTPLWQLMAIGGLVAGLLAESKKILGLSSSLGSFFAWLTYILIKIGTQSSFIMLDQVAHVIIGRSGLGFVFLILILAIGTLYGYLGGILGNYIRKIIVDEKDKKNTTTGLEDLI